MYVEYQIPVGKPFRYPLVFMHGGGHTGQFWRTTPDGRQGFFTSFTRRGFSVYSLDAANRGRAGWEPTIRFAVSQGLLPPSDLEEADIYSEQAAWTSFRWSRLGTSDPSQFQQTVSNLQALGGDATCIPLPTVGLLGNGHTMAIEKNNEQIADLIETWIRDRPFSRPRPTPPKPPPPPPRVTG